MKPPQPPAPPSVIVAEELPKKRPTPKPLDELGIAPDLFAAVAMSSPVEWDGEQLDNLQKLFEGEEVEAEVQAELVDELLSPPKRATQDVPPTISRTWEAPSGGLSQFGLDSAPVPTQLEVPSSRVNIDDWLRKTKG